jgi:hypothetical protein
MRYWWVNQNQTSRQEIEGGLKGLARSLWLFSKDINPGASVASFCVHRCNHAPIAAPFKVVKTSPMLGKFRGLENVNVY